MVLTTVMRNVRDTGTILRTSIFSLFAQAPLELGIADGLMTLSTGFVLPLQQLFAQGMLSWSGGGYILHHIIQTLWLGAWIYLPFFMEWQWYVLPLRYTAHNVDC